MLAPDLKSPTTTRFLSIKKRQNLRNMSMCGTDPFFDPFFDPFLLQSIAKNLNPLRPGRSEPRVKKRRPKNYRLMTKPHKEMGPLPHRKVGVEKHPKKVLT